MKRILVIEDGTEYEEFARLFLSESFSIQAAHSSAETLEIINENSADGFLIDLRFDRAEEDSLEGDIDETAERLFAGNRAEAVRYLKDNQGVLILATLRAAGHAQPAVFVHDFPKQRLENLRRLYGEVKAVPSFDAAAIRRLFDG
jgi:CheY-like chemotaxis protein